MKKNFLKVFSLLLVISMLAISVNAVVTDKPQSEITIAAEPGTVVLCQGNTVIVTLTMPTCYGIEGQWTATSGLTLTSLTRDGGATLSHTNGVVEWADVEGTDETKWFTNPMKTMTATYTVTEAGTYTVDFTCTVFAGGKQITAGDIEVWEGTFKYSVDIQVVEHDYSEEWKSDETNHWHECACGAKSEEAAHSDETTKDHKCDTCGYVMGECADSDDADHKCDHCGKDGITDHVYGEAWKSDETNHWHECACGAKSEEAAHSDETTKDHKCDTCGYEMSECSDSDDADHKCDHCGKDGITDHVYGTEWKTDETKHWHVCDCGAKSDEGAHTGGTATCTDKAVCSTCNTAYGDKNPSNHTSTEVTYKNITDTTHDEYYACCDVLKSAAVEHTYNQADNKCVCGAEKPVTDVVVTAKGTINHTVEGQVVTVTHSVACKVGYWDEAEGKYIAIAAVANADGSYSFTAPEGVTEVLLVVKGDANGTGELDVGDMSRIKAVLMGRTTLTAEATFAADANATNALDVGDMSRIKAVLMGRTTIAWG